MSFIGSVSVRRMLQSRTPGLVPFMQNSQVTQGASGVMVAVVFVTVQLVAEEVSAASSTVMDSSVTS